MVDSLSEDFDNYCGFARERGKRAVLADDSSAKEKNTEQSPLLIRRHPTQSIMRPKFQKRLEKPVKKDLHFDFARSPNYLRTELAVGHASLGKLMGDGGGAGGA